MNREHPPGSLTYGQIWEQFKATYMAKGLSEAELRHIHLKWINARAYAEKGAR